MNWRGVLIALAALAVALLPAYRVSDAVAVEPVTRKRIAITFDDVPRGPGAFLATGDRTDRIIAGLKAAQVPQVALFLNPARMSPAAEARVAAYVAAGAVLANHTNSHRHLSSSGAAAYLADIDAATAWLKGRPGYRPWFRFPFLDEGGPDKAKRDAVRAGLDMRGLRNGYVTVDGSDWQIEGMTIAAKRAGRPIDMAGLRDLYVDTMVRSADFSDGLMMRTLGRSPAHVLLLHETDIAALFLPDLIEALRADGWRIVSADEAYRDDIGRVPPDTPWAAGTLAEALAWQSGYVGRRSYERNEPKIAHALFREKVWHE